jgi:hypothetical protein
MRTKHSDRVKYLQFESFPDQKVIHAIFTRQGGVSPAPWESLNQGGTTGDSRERVIENRRIAFNNVGLKVETIFDVWQVHGTKIIATDKPRDLDQPHKKADGILTSQKGVTLFMRFADCVPILLFDPNLQIISIVHAGWQGTVKRIAETAVDKMVNIYHCDRENIIVGIGPSIGPDHYHVKEDVISQVTKAYPENWKNIIWQQGDSFSLDLWEANRICLEEAGIKKIEIAGLCTACNLEDWYSHRAEGSKTGRFGVLLAMK